MKNQQQGKISLRRLTMDDTEKIFQMSQEESLARFLPDQVYQNQKEASKVLEYLIGSYEEIDIEKAPYVLGVILNDNELIGHVGASKIREGVEIGYAIEKRHQGFGYAQQAVSQMLQMLETNTIASEIYGIVDLENEASKKVLEKCGFVKVDQKLDKLVYKRVLTRSAVAHLRSQ
ncbi:MAG TPA: GNAT family N-acetyltransferase [Oculatellaceae cyanobacterium]